MQRLPVISPSKAVRDFLVAHAARAAGAHIIPARRQASGTVDRPTRASCKLFATTVSIQTICQQNVRNASSLTFLNDIFVRFPIDIC
jgi:hypothetical protein